MPQLIFVLTMMVTLSGGGAEEELGGRWVPPPSSALPRTESPTQPQDDPAMHRQDNTTYLQTLPCYPFCKVTGSPQSQVSHQEEHQSKEDITRILEADTSMAENTINFVKEKEATTSMEKVYEDDTINEIEDTSSHKDTVSGVFNKGDIAIPYESLGWFSKAVEAAMDGSLYIGLALGVMFFSASVLSGAIGVFEDTCLICAFIGYANTVDP